MPVSPGVYAHLINRATIRAEIARKDLEIQAVRQALGWKSNNSWDNFINGITEPTLPKCIALSEILEVPINKLFHIEISQ